MAKQKKNPNREIALMRRMFISAMVLAKGDRKKGILRFRFAQRCPSPYFLILIPKRARSLCDGADFDEHDVVMADGDGVLAVEDAEVFLTPEVAHRLFAGDA